MGGLFDGGITSKEGNVRIVKKLDIKKGLTIPGDRAKTKILRALMNLLYVLKYYGEDSCIEFARMLLFFLLL